MAAVDVGARNIPAAPAVDDLDDLCDYNVGDIFRDVDTNIDFTTPHISVADLDDKKNSRGLGIDEEIKITKKRAPVPKLDDNRLLGPAGIPKLRRTTKDCLRFKGKGHEYSDISRLLNFYQLWLDELYPRAKFADGLTMIEKLGHTKRMQTMRREWINEGKAKKDLVELGIPTERDATRQPDRHPSHDRSTGARKTTELRTSPAFDDDVDLGSVTQKDLRLNEASKHGIPSSESLFVSDGEDEGDQIPGDELDILFDADGTNTGASTLRCPSDAHVPRKEDEFEDEMEALAGMDDIW